MPGFRLPRGPGALIAFLATMAIVSAQAPRGNGRDFIPPDLLRRDNPANNEDRRPPGVGGYDRGARLPEAASGGLVRLEGGGVIDEETVRTARETASHSTGTPEWSNPSGFEKDVFTFARVIFRSNFGRYGYGGRTGWVNDYPDADLNLSWRLQQLTALRVDPDCRVVKITSAELFDFPFVYMIKPGRMELTDEQVHSLRKYLLNGGAMLIDDTWGRDEWTNVEREMQRVLPGRAWTELPREHPIFRCVFPLDKDKLQIPPIQRWSRGSSSRSSAPDAERAYFRAWLDDQGRIIALSAHNTDLGDGWEREGENDEYFHTFSEPRAYPMAINIIFYLMTH